MSSADALTHRLVVQRLEAPGVLDRPTIERTRARFSQAANAHVLPRLQRRAAPAAVNAGSLPLVRIDRSVEPGAATPGAATFGPVTQATDGGTATPSAPRVETAIAFAGSLAARHAPGISHASPFVERRSERNHAVDIPVAARLLARAAHATTTPSTFAPAIITRAAATSVLQRVADAGNRARVAAPTPAASAIPASPVHRASSPLATSDARMQPVAQMIVAPANDASPTNGATAHAASATPATNGIVPDFQNSQAVGFSTVRAPATLVLRKANPTQSRSASIVPVVTPTVVTAAPPRLLLRKPDIADDAHSRRDVDELGAGSAGGASIALNHRRTARRRWTACPAMRPSSTSTGSPSRSATGWHAASRSNVNAWGCGDGAK